MPEGPVVVIGTPASGAMGLNLTAAHTVVYISNDFSLKTRLQSEDRVHRPGQMFPTSYFDIIATGPAGQKTIDHTVVKSLKAKLELATFTTSAWIQVLMEE
jgi:SNF2 family DNA or RNA helicase